MYLNSHRVTALIGLAAICSLGACRKEEDSSALQQDSTLSRDLARAGTDTTAQPALKDVPAAPAAAPRSTTPRPRTSAPVPKVVTPAPAPATPAEAKGEVTKAPVTGNIAGGTTLSLASSEKVCTNSNKVGDRFTATVNETVSGTNGAAIPAGSNVTIEITSLHRSENANDRIVMGFRVVSITVGGKTYYPDADVVTASVDRVASANNKTTQKVIGGAVAGAIIGQVIGRDRKGTLIGAAAGAAAGGAAAAATANHDGCVNNGAPITIKLNQPLTITVA